MKATNLETIWPLSPLQEGLLFHSLQEPEEGLYVEQATCTLEGSLDAAALRQAWQAVVDGNAALRAGFLWRGLERPVQPVRRRLEVPWSQEDWQDLTGSEQQQRFEALMREDRRRGFPADRPPLLRLHLLRTAQREHRFLWTFHHLLLDGWSVFLVLEEVLASYAMAVTGRALPGSPGRRSFGDYLGWLKGKGAGQEAFWREYLAPISRPTPLPVLAAPASPGQSSSSGELRHDLSTSESESLRKLARGAGTTLNTLMEAAWGLLLARFTGEQQVLFGSVVSGRPPELAGAEKMIGLFLNTVPVAIQVLWRESATGWLRLLHHRSARRRSFEHSPLPKVKSWSSLPPGAEIFHTLLAFENYPRRTELLEGAGGAPLKIHRLDVRESTHYPITLVALPEERLKLLLEFRSPWVGPTDAQRLLAHLVNLLRSLGVRPEAPLSCHPLLSAGERHQVLVAWGTGEALEGKVDSVASFLAQQARRRPTAWAVEDSIHRISYQELWQRAVQAGDKLRGTGLGPGGRTEQPVALLAEPSAEAAIAWVALLLSGAVVLPLEPSLPKERLARLLSEAAVSLVVSDAPRGVDDLGLPTLPWWTISTLLSSAASQPTCVQGPLPGEKSSSLSSADFPAREPVSAEAAAYLLTTSGSTGRPKGVVVSHGALAHHSASAAQRYRLRPTDRVLQFASWSFDVAIEELFASWKAGATVVLCRPQDRSSWATFSSFLENQRITVANLPASFWHGWVQSLEVGSLELTAPPAALRLTLVGNEAVLPHNLTTWQSRTQPRQRLVCAYGPTEATVTALSHRPARPEPDPQRLAALPLGRPLPGRFCRILDPSLRPVLPGAAGELALGGAGLARGYWRRPAETARRFVPDPFCATPGGRLYRTGDRARWRGDGVVEFLGRGDRQLQVRGFRIEPGEVEAALETHPGVVTAFVTAAPQREGSDDREDSDGPTGLIAYIEALEQHSPGEHLIAWSKQRLPHYMVPFAIVVLEELPRLPSGKVDVHKLPQPSSEAEGPVGDDQPETAQQLALAAIWQQVLHVPHVRPRDDFFALGGDSISSLLIAERARAQGLKLAPRTLLEERTLERVAAAMTELSGTAEPEKEHSGEIPLTPLQRWFFEAQPSAPHHWNQALFLEVPDALAASPLEEALWDVVRHHDALRLCFHRGDDSSWKQDGAWKQTLHPTAPRPLFGVIDLQGLSPSHRAAQRSRAASTLQSRLDLGKGELVACFYSPGSPPSPGSHHRRGRLFLAIHHLVVDAVSWGPLLRDLETAYQARCAGREPFLPPPTTSFAAWACQLRDFAASPKGRQWLAQENASWLRAPQTPSIPRDRDGDNTVASVQRLEVDLSPQASRSLMALPGGRAQEILLTAFALAVKSWSTASAFQVDVEGHGRLPPFEGVDLSRTVGCFTALYPVVLDLGGTTGPGEALARVEQTLGQLSPGGLAFGIGRYLGDPELVEALRRLPRSPASFNYLGRLDLGGGGWRLGEEDPGVTESPESLRRHRWDLNVYPQRERLVISWAYSRAVHGRRTIRSLAQATREQVEILLEEKQHRLKPGDFPLARLDEQAWQGLVSRLPQSRLPGGRLSEAGIVEGREIPWEDIYPLTPLQQGLVFHSALAPTAGHYHSQLSCTLEGELNPAAFRAAWQWVVDRHPVLRTALLPGNQKAPLQAVFRQVEVPGTLVDWRALSPSAAQEHWSLALQSDARRGFSLEQPPLLRWLLVRLRPKNQESRQQGARQQGFRQQDARQQAPSRHRLLFSHHHLLLDGWSNALLLAELWAAYEALAQGRTPRGDDPRSASPAPFREYVAWLSSQPSRREEWRNLLKDFEQATPLPRDHPSRESLAQEGFRDTRARGQISEPSLEPLRSKARRQGLTLSSLCQAAWGLLLSRWGDTRDVLFGITLANRTLPLQHMERRLGLFIHTLPLRLRLPRGSSLGTWLARVRSQQLALLERPPESLVELQRLSRLPPGAPLFESLLVYESYPVAAALDGGAQGLVVSAPQSQDRPHLPLSLAILPGEGLELLLAYQSHLLEPATARRLLGQFTTLLLSLALSDETPLDDLSLLGQEERQQVLLEWSRGAELAGGLQHDNFQDGNFQDGNFQDGNFRDHGPNTLAQLLTLSAQRWRDHPAVAQGPLEWSYGELYDRGARLAIRLRDAGVGPETLVAVHLQRSAHLIVAWTAVALAGGAYLPLDTSAPLQRRLSLLREALPGSEVPVVLADSSDPFLSSAKESGIVDLRVVDPTVTPSLGPSPTLPSSPGPGNLAYVLFTSGSSGRPKGVAISQQAIVHHTRWWVEAAELGPGDTVMQRVSPSFDPCGLEIWGTLAAGARLALPPLGDADDPAAVAGQIRTQGITVMAAPPSWLEMLVLQPGLDQGSLRLIVSGGEALSTELAARLARASGARVDNLYGPTEATITATYQRDASRGTLPAAAIGRPIGGYKAWVLDRWGGACPAGAPGELFIGGPGLARGYWRSPAHTASCFTPDDLGEIPGARLYRSGDGVRWDAQGRLLFAGRRDGQLKVRGVRVEPGEVEQALRNHPAVHQAVVVAVNVAMATSRAASRANRLAAFLIGPDLPSTEELRDHLADRLPTPLIPGRFIPLETLPRTSSGKVDRQALTELAGQATPHRSLERAPRDELERQLTEIWKEILEIPQVGIEADFFDLGGHSLLAMRLAREIEQRLELSLPLEEALRRPTVAEQAAFLRRTGSESRPWSSVISFPGGGDLPPMAWVHPGSGLAWGFGDLARLLRRDRQVFGLQARGLTPDQTPQSTVEEMAATYLEHLNRHHKEGPWILGGWSFGGFVAYEMAQQLTAAGQPPEALVILDVGPESLRARDRAEGVELLTPWLETLPLDDAEGAHWRSLENSQERLRWLLRKGQEKGWLPASLGEEAAGPMAAVAQSLEAAGRLYKPKAYAGDLLLIRPSEPRETVSGDTDLGWQDLVQGGVQVHWAAGTHETLLQQPQVDQLAPWLRRWLARRRAEGKAS